MAPQIYSEKRFGVNSDQLSKNALGVIDKLQKKGFDAYIVGGGIRDLIKGIQPKDFDIATNCQPEEIRKLFKNSRIIGRRFQLVHIAFPNEIIETTTFRSGKDSNDDSMQINDGGRILRDNVWGTQEEDVFRRDFTINSIYYDPFSKEIIDYTAGIKDLKSKVIKFIGDPEQRIMEDPVRILRAIRFAAKLNFKIEKRALLAIKKYRAQIADMPPARVYEEIAKLFLLGHSENSYSLLKEFGVLQILFPHTNLNNERYDTFFTNAFRNTDNRFEQNKKLNPGFLFATLLWPKVFEESEIETKINFRKFYQTTANVIRRQQLITAIPRRFTSFIKDVWMYQIRFNKIGKKSISFSQSLRFRAAYDFLLIRKQLEPDLEERINWWTEFKTANYDKKIRLLKSKRKR
ncbi:MAG: polynucleotide adenylyltransferase PcnB [SAR86 cluster bacterium]|uniref:Poly(A) polymerase I n=1 Tax=SAR86 cluster bacterium TaxID=2030880 RepID=A0A368BQK2_9GAMM|nr:MAG: polynucleotide adenylyltransferase PcnB [SAR86 cluster bacterium]